MPGGLYPSGDWEPIPDDVRGRELWRQRRGFRERSAWPLRWNSMDWRAFPEKGIFGHDARWHSDREVYAFCSHAGEDLLLINLIWSGFPDPPEWGLWSRRSEDQDASWSPWGHFVSIPAAWVVPGLDKSGKVKQSGSSDEQRVDSDGA